MNTIKVSYDIREENRRLSEDLSVRFGAAGVRAIGLVGSPGSGKTTLLEYLLPRLSRTRRVAVIEGDVATDNDARRIRATGVDAVEINTLGACHLDSAMIEKALCSLKLNAYDMLVIENVGNLVCPVAFPLGESLRLAVISAAEGEDKPQKYPAAILNTNAVIITKTDIAPYVRCDPARMAYYAKEINPATRVFFCGMDPDGLYTCRSADGEDAQSLEELLLG